MEADVLSRDPFKNQIPLVERRVERPEAIETMELAREAARSDGELVEALGAGERLEAVYAPVGPDVCPVGEGWVVTSGGRSVALRSVVESSICETLVVEAGVSDVYGLRATSSEIVFAVLDVDNPGVRDADECSSVKEYDWRHDPPERWARYAYRAVKALTQRFF